MNTRLDCRHCMCTESAAASRGWRRRVAYLENHLMNLPMMWRSTTEKTKAIDRTRTTTGSTLRPLLSSVYRRIMVDDEPPAPAARGELGLLAACCAARRLFGCIEEGAKCRRSSQSVGVGSRRIRWEWNGQRSSSR